MYFFNEYEIDRAVDRYVRPGIDPDRRNTAKATMVLHRLMVWTNNNSDGWAYWPKPMRAATKLAKLVEARLNARGWESRELGDISDTELKKALMPIKSFLTRQGIAHSEIIKES
jgi:hypothetical protein